MNRHCTTPVAILAAILAAASAAFGTNEYSGASDGDWFVDANWSLGRVPTAADDVEISLSSVNATGSIVAASITLSSATLRLGSETCSNVVASATISGDLTLEGASKLYVFAGELPESEWSVFADNATAIAALYAAANTVTVGGAFTVDDTSVVYPAAALLTGVPVFFRVGTFSLAEGASFDAKKRGWGWSADAWANAPAYAKPRRQEGAIENNGWTFAIGSGLSYSIGGSYGGTGINTPTTWQGSTYGTTYGSLYAPFLPGSPAGAYQMGWDRQHAPQNLTLRARGPGSVVVLASGAAAVDGTIDASGVPHASGYTYEHSGASGGGIWLAAASFTFGVNASLLASGENSANNAYASGGGGRIAVIEGIDPADYSILLSGSLPDDAQTASLAVAHTVAAGAMPNGTQAAPGTAVKVEPMNTGAVDSICWTGAVGTRDWFNRANWSPNIVPGPAHDVYCTNAAITVTNAITIRSLTLAGASDFAVQALPAPGASDAASLYAAATAVVFSNRLEIGGTTTVTLRNDPVTGAAVKLACGDFLLGHDAAINANGGGWFWYASANDEYAVDTAGAYQTRALGRGYSWTQGAGHAGLGGASAAPYGRTYGLQYAPFLPGSPNGLHNNAISNGHPGGGTVWIVCSGTLELEGTITANGERSNYGAPSGGGVWLAARGVTVGTDASVSAMGGTLTADNYGSTSGGGRVSLALGLTQAQLDALAAGETPEGLSYEDSIGLFAVDVRGGKKEAATPTYGNPGTATTVRGALADTDIAVRGAPVLATGVSPAYGHYGYASGTTATLTAPAYGYDPDDPEVRYPCAGYVVSNATTEVDSGAGTQVEFIVGADDLTVTWLWGAPQPRTVVRKPANGALRVNGETLAGDAVLWSLGDLPAVSVVPDAGHAFVCWEGNVPFGQAFDNPLSLSVDSPVDIAPVLRLDEAAATRTWSGTGLWTDTTKWSPAGNIPGPGDTVVIASGTCFVSNALTAAALQVTGGTLSVGTAGGDNPFVSVSGDAAFSGGTVNLGFGPRMTGHARLAVGGDLALSGVAKLNVYGGPVDGAFAFASGCSFVDVGGALALDGTATLSLYSDYLTGGSVKVAAGSVAVGASATIEANEKGYMWLDSATPPDAPGLGFSYTQGASHGGVGGGNAASTAYGQRLAPVQPGSPNGCYANNYGNINRGGGLVRIHAAGAFEVDGAIAANAKATGDFGGGSGGGIWLTAHTFAFGASATLSARGGRSNYSSNGGGGRIALGCQLSGEQIAELAATGEIVLKNDRILDEASFREGFGNASMTVDVGSIIDRSGQTDHPGTFAFVNGKKYRTLIIMQ